MPGSVESDQKLVPLRVALLLAVAVGVPATADELRNFGGTP